MHGPGCLRLVVAMMEKLALRGTVLPGEVDLPAPLTAAQHGQLQAALAAVGMELRANKRPTLVESIRRVIVEMVNDNDPAHKTKNSVYISSRLHYDYTYLANIFSLATGRTIEHFVIARKIERVKDLLRFGELTLTQISHKLNYSSVAHLSHQFKKVTGLTPSLFKQCLARKCVNCVIFCYSYVTVFSVPAPNFAAPQLPHGFN